MIRKWNDASSTRTASVAKAAQSGRDAQSATTHARCQGVQSRFTSTSLEMEARHLHH